MKKPVDIEKFHTDGRSHDNKIKDVARQFARALVYEAESGRRDLSVEELRGAGTDESRDNMSLGELVGHVGRQTLRREPTTDTERAALDAEAEYERHRDDIDSGKMRHISEPSDEGALRKLAREVVRDGSFDNADIDPQDADRLSSDQILDALVQAVRDRRAGK